MSAFIDRKPDRALAFSPRGDRLYSLWGEWIFVFEIPSGRIHHTLENDEDPYHIAWRVLAIDRDENWPS